MKTVLLILGCLLLIGATWYGLSRINPQEKGMCTIKIEYEMATETREFEVPKESEIKMGIKSAGETHTRYIYYYTEDFNPLRFEKSTGFLMDLSDSMVDYHILP